MKIEYFGHSCFAITAKNGFAVLTDPYRGVGYEMPSGLCADVVTVSHGHFDHNYVDVVRAKKVLTVIDNYRINGVEIYGVPCYHDPKKGALRGENIAFIIKMDGVTLCHLGDVGEECSPALVEKIGKVDILLIPVGGTYTVDAVGAKKYIDAIAPRAVLPMHYRPQDGSLDITGIQPFLALYKGGSILHLPNGVLEDAEKASGVIYLERVK